MWTLWRLDSWLAEGNHCSLSSVGRLDGYWLGVSVVTVQYNWLAVQQQDQVSGKKTLALVSPRYNRIQCNTMHWTKKRILVLKHKDPTGWCRQLIINFPFFLFLWLRETDRPPATIKIIFSVHNQNEEVEVVEVVGAAGWKCSQCNEDN